MTPKDDMPLGLPAIAAIKGTSTARHDKMFVCDVLVPCAPRSSREKMPCIPKKNKVAAGDGNPGLGSQSVVSKGYYGLK